MVRVFMEGDGWTRKGPWTEQEDMQLIQSIQTNGVGRWNFIPKAAGLERSGKSCRLRWMNYLRPGLKRSKITAEEERLIIDMHQLWGNRWARIAQSLPGRTDNEVKNYFKSHIKKKLGGTHVEKRRSMGKTHMGEFFCLRYDSESSYKKNHEALEFGVCDTPLLVGECRKSEGIKEWDFAANSGKNIDMEWEDDDFWDFIGGEHRAPLRW